MRAWGWMAVVSILSGPAYADSLGEVAKREQVRCEKKKQQGAPAHVIRDEDLTAAPGKDAKGTFNLGTGFASAPAASPSPSAGVDVAVSAVDAIRAGAPQRLESTYARIDESAQSLLGAVGEYERCVNPAIPRCRSLRVTIATLSIRVATSMEDAEDGARQGWLAPGEVRAMRQRYGMDDAAWDSLVRMVQRYLRSRPGGQRP